ncbi:hypothetical protein STEG23_027105 [Scotinomys teguina]
MMNDIILEIYDLPKSYLACTLLAFTLIIHTAFKYWLTNKKKDESLLVHKKILSLKSANQDLQNRLLNLESANLMQELQSINNKCIAKIGFVDNKYEYLMDRTLTLQSEVVTTQTLCKEERSSPTDKIRSLESCVSEEHNRWYDSLKNLESQAREEVHSLEQTLCARLQALEETLCKHDKEPNKQKGVEKPLPDCPWEKEEPVVWETNEAIECHLSDMVQQLTRVNASKSSERRLVQQEEAENPACIPIFWDHTKLILCPMMAAVTYINKNGDFCTYCLSLMEEYGCCKELGGKLGYAHTMVDRLLRSKSTGNRLKDF